LRIRLANFGRPVSRGNKNRAPAPSLKGLSSSKSKANISSSTKLHDDDYFTTIQDMKKLSFAPNETDMVPEAVPYITSLNDFPPMMTPKLVAKQLDAGEVEMSKNNAKKLRKMVRDIEKLDEYEEKDTNVKSYQDISNAIKGRQGSKIIAQRGFKANEYSRRKQFGKISRKNEDTFNESIPSYAADARYKKDVFDNLKESQKAEAERRARVRTERALVRVSLEERLQEKRQRKSLKKDERLSKTFQVPIQDISFQSYEKSPYSLSSDDEETVVFEAPSVRELPKLPSLADAPRVEPIRSDKTNSSSHLPTNRFPRLAEEH